MPPSAVISSGFGFHTYWLLDAPVDVARARAINTALCDRLGGDRRLIAPSAILRVPGCLHRKSGEPVPVVPFGGWWTPGAKMIAYPASALPSADVVAVAVPRSARTDRFEALVQRVAERALRARVYPDGRVAFLCFLHEDRHASAVVFPEGNFHCAACKINEPAWRWTRRPEVANWGVAALVPARSRTDEALVEPASNELRAPRTAVKVIGPLLSRKLHLRESRGGVLRMAMTTPAGSRVSFDSPEQLAIALRAAGGAMTYRVFWACVALAQRRPIAGGRKGGFTCRPDDIADLLGCRRYEDGRHHTEVRQGVGAALDALACTEIEFRWAPKSSVFIGPIVANLGRFEGRPDTRVLHHGIWRQLTGNSRAWAPWRVDALQLDDEMLALYLLVQWELRERQLRGREIRPLPLAAVASRAGVWNAERFALTPGRYVESIARRFAAVPALGMEVQQGEAGVTVFAVREETGDAYTLWYPAGRAASSSVTCAENLREPSHLPARTVPPGTVCPPLGKRVRACRKGGTR